MDTITGIINLDHEQDMDELTYFRCGAAVPFAGRYRMIDFIMSNMINSGIESIAIFARRKYRSLMDHIEEGKAWDLDRKRGGVFILPPDWNDPTDISKGDLQHFHNNIDFLERTYGNYFLVSGSQNLCNLDFNKVLEAHKEAKADVTVLYKEVDELNQEHRLAHKVTVNEQNRVIDIHNEQQCPNVYLDMFLVEKSLMIRLVKECIAHGKNHFFLDSIKAKLSELHINGYHFTGTHICINSLESYYRHSKALLEDETMYEELFNTKAPILTKIKNEPPVKYYSTAEVSNSLLANGSTIQGQVENSILFRGVQVAEGAIIKNSIIMQRCEIARGAVLENVILDKDCKISEGRTLVGAPEKPYVMAKRSSM